MSKKIYYWAAFLGFIWACQTTKNEIVNPAPELPFNPYDTLTYPQTQVPNIVIDSASFMGLHQNIFSQRCAQPACHDGTFEPDFRSVQSAYSSLVYQPINKNYPSNPLSYRVTPFDTAQSMLWKRVTIHNPPNFEIMPSSGNRIPQAEIDNIRDWIMGGARDIFGNVPSLSSLQPTSFGLVAFSTLQGNARIDSARNGVFYQPFMVNQQDTVDLWFGYFDQTITGDTVLGDVLTHNKIRFSNNSYNFTASPDYNLTKYNLLTANYLRVAFSQDIAFQLPYTHHIRVIPADMNWRQGDVIYIRTYVRDADHNQPTELPNDGSQAAIKSYFSLIIQ